MNHAESNKFWAFGHYFGGSGHGVGPFWPISMVVGIDWSHFWAIWGVCGMDLGLLGLFPGLWAWIGASQLLIFKT